MISEDDATFIVYGHEELPTISFARPLAGKEESSLATYLTGPFLLDPFYRAAAYDQQFGVFRLADLAPASFRSSEYYKNWYKHCGYEDECGLLIRLANENFINISIGLTSEGARLKVRQAKLLASIYELTASLCRRHFSRRTAAPSIPSSSPRPSWRSSSHLRCFGPMPGVLLCPVLITGHLRKIIHPPHGFFCS